KHFTAGAARLPRPAVRASSSSTHVSIHKGCRLICRRTKSFFRLFWSCTRSLRIIPLPLKPATMPRLTMPERGQYHGFTPFVLSTRSVGPRVALLHAACCRVSPRGSDTTDCDAPQAQKQTLQHAETL